MFEKLEIKKEEDKVIVIAKLKKRVLTKTPKFYFSWVEAKKLVRERYPDLKIEDPLSLKHVLHNYDKVCYEENWIFPIKQEPKQEQKQEPKQEPKKQVLNFKKKKNKIQKTTEQLTNLEKPATVEETEQSLSDQPVIVQEPTE